MADLLTTNLRLELEKTNQQFQRWSDSQKDRLEANQQLYDSNLEASEYNIQSLQKSNVDLESARKSQDGIKSKQNEEIKNLESKQAERALKIEGVNQLLLVTSEEERAANSSLERLKMENERLKQQMESKLQDLTFGVKNFLHLGLEFQKAANDCMKFNFSLLDPNIPSRQFSFTIFVDSSNLYQLVDTMPPLRVDLCIAAIQDLNKTNDIAKFVVRMRKLFQQIVYQNTV